MKLLHLTGFQARCKNCLTQNILLLWVSGCPRPWMCQAVNPITFEAGLKRSCTKVLVEICCWNSRSSYRWKVVCWTALHKLSLAAWAGMKLWGKRNCWGWRSWPSSFESSSQHPRGSCHLSTYLKQLTIQRKKWLGNHNQKTLEERRVQLEKYLCDVVSDSRAVYTKEFQLFINPDTKEEVGIVPPLDAYHW